MTSYKKFAYCNPSVIKHLGSGKILISCLKSGYFTYAMGRAKRLTLIERGKILALHDSGLKSREIALKIGRSKTVVNDYLNNQQNYGTNKGAGRHSCLTSRQKRAICKLACNKKLYAPEIKQVLGLTCSVRTVRNVLSKDPTVLFARMKKKPPLKSEQKQLRLKFAKDHVAFGDKWQDVVFSDEKKFNLDGPDGFRSYWHDLRHERPYFSKRQFGGGSVMVWGGVTAHGTTPLVFINTRLNSEGYQDMLAENLLPHAPLITSGDYLFLQDNASIHVSASTNAWFDANEVKILTFPAKSPDLNPMENVWGILVREVYKNGRQFQRKSDLVDAIKSAWEAFSKDTLKTLAGSMTSRLIKVIEKKGAQIDY